MSLLRPQVTTRDALRNAYVRLRTPKDLAGGKGSPALPPWTVSDSNRPPPACKAGALPDELTARVMAFRRPGKAIEPG